MRPRAHGRKSWCSRSATSLQRATQSRSSTCSRSTSGSATTRWKKSTMVQSTLFEAIPEPTIPKRLSTTACTRLSARSSPCSTEGRRRARSPSDDLITGYHASATYEEVVERFTADGFEVFEAR